jgi:hypothetical protein
MILSGTAILSAWASSRQLFIPKIAMATFDRATRLQNIRLRHQLVANSKTNYRTVIFKSEKEGVRDIQKLVDSSVFEEVWAFIPAESAWYEIGILEKAEVENEHKDLVTESSIDWKYLDALEKGKSEVKIYHFHPAFPKPPSTGSMNDEELADLKVISDIRDQRDALPSAMDLQQMIHETTYFQGFVRGARVMTWVLCSKLGVTEFALTPSGLNYFADQKAEHVAGYAQRLLKTAQKNYLVFREDRKFNKGEMEFDPVREAYFYTHRYSTPEIRARFQSYENFYATRPQANEFKLAADKK